MSAFEALCARSWQPVESIRISHGRMIICTVDDRYAIEESGPFTNVRIKSRQATLSDCTCFLRPGVDICVLSPSEKSNGFGELQEPEWVDARISSIERKPHESRYCWLYKVDKWNRIEEDTLPGLQSYTLMMNPADIQQVLSKLYKSRYQGDPRRPLHGPFGLVSRRWFVYQLLLVNTLEEEKYWRIAWKECVSSMIFRKAFVEDPSCWQRNKLEDKILREMVEEDKSKSIHAIMKNEKASTN
ncbi:hypothetical protein NL676_005074 [Syzygium grande]|nr:hypothetical protein NL676_005074 [Syzygium grande]